MQWEGRRGSENVEDRRGQGGMLSGRSGCSLGGGIGVLVVALIVWLMGGNPL